ncbi:MAG: RagB/SusD family nutrient uptake outer membrane protein [Muribaculum sp.]|nr:RagB/SusD family nutrient uptake outer membrane protein [Muribaculaceae bacterium]MCM1081109.1 RagB/SusD family nutrient uptake outer membrane protein [Muribaculum sp.]
MNKYILSTFALGLSAIALTGCDDFLDTMPDNRATLNTEDKIMKTLTSAYMDHEYCLPLELLTDNVDNFGTRVPNSDRWFDDTFAWKDEVETCNEAFDRLWSTTYLCIASANEALAAIGEHPATERLGQLRGEGLLSRAFHHFLLGSIFCDAWTQDAENSLGIPYMEHPESDLDPKYERGNLADFYDKIERDLVEGLSLVSDAYYTVPKYHFNTKAAYAFACRFYLFKEEWAKAIEYADKCLGSEPKAVLRDWAYMASITQDAEAVNNEYISASSNANLLLITGYSRLGLVFGPYTSYGRYNHGKQLAETEDIRATNLYGSYGAFRITPKVYQGSTYNKTIFWKAPYKFEYTDLVAGIGFTHTVVPILTTDECLLNRAEAYIMLKQFDKAAADLTTWMQNMTTSTKVLTPAEITTFYNARKYSYEDEKNPLVGTIKKHIHPAFAIDEEGSVQENMLQCMLSFRRIETLHQGLRWFDIKRYGIEIPRRLLDDTGNPESITDWLRVGDPRRAVQIPLRVRDAGMEANPR